MSNTPNFTESIEEPMLRYFNFDHLPADLRKISQKFALLANTLIIDLPWTPERTVALRKLLESKDAAVRAAVDARGATDV